MARYAVEMNRTMSTTQSVGTIGADATRPRRGRWYYIAFGSEATPADSAIRWIVQRCTALGTSTSVTPQPLESADAQTEADAGENHSAEPTYTANQILLAVAQNAKTTFQWRAPAGDELVYPATASNGLGIQTPTAPAQAVTVTVHFREE